MVRESGGHHTGDREQLVILYLPVALAFVFSYLRNSYRPCGRQGKKGNQRTYPQQGAKQIRGGDKGGEWEGRGGKRENEETSYTLTNFPLQRQPTKNYDDEAYRIKYHHSPCRCEGRIRKFDGRAMLPTWHSA